MTSVPLRSALASRTAMPWRRPQPLLLSPDGLRASDGTLHAGFDAWAAAHPGTPCTLFVGGAWTHTVVCDPALPLDDDAAVAAYARQLLTHYHGTAASRWPLASWRAGESRGACALHGVDRAALQRSAAAHGVRLRALRPVWPQSLAAALREAPALREAEAATLWLLEPGLATRLALRRGRPMALQQHRVGRAPLQALQALVGEQAGGEPQWAAGHGWHGALPEAVRRIGAVDGAWQSTASSSTRAALPPLEFLPARRGPVPLAMAAAVAAALVAVTAGLDAREAWQARDAAQAEQARLQAEAVRLRTTPSRAAGAAAAASPLPARLSHPWPLVFAATEQATAPGVRWLAWQHQAERGELRLQGLAPDAATATAALQLLAAAPGIEQVLLTRLQREPTDGNGLRFDITARWHGAGAAR